MPFESNAYLSRDELAAWLRLELTPSIGSRSARQLLAAFGLPGAIFEASARSLEQVVTARQRTALQQEPAELAALLDKTWAWLESEPHHNRILVLGDAAYPQGLLNMDDPPTMLYARGSDLAWSLLEQHNFMAYCVGVVGSRNPTAQGAINARQFSQALAAAGLTVVSGLALGVDGAANEGALAGASEGGIPTIAIVGTGLDRVYPSQHKDLAHRIARHGLLLSEYPLGTPPLATNFPKRNRLIAGLSSATLVVEAALQSGSLITARLASEQGKDVFAIPGSIHCTQAKGCHALIKQGAKLVETAEDILEEMGTNSPTQRTRGGASEDQEVVDSVLTALLAGPLGLDALQVRTGLDVAALQALLMQHEMEGRVARLPGGIFQRLMEM